jgi:hypothetical protein
VQREDTVQTWCGSECATGRRARDLRLGEHVAVWASRFPEVEAWPERIGHIGRDVWPFRGFARLAVVSSVTDAEVTLTNPGGARAGTEQRGPQGTDDRQRATEEDAPESLTVPADYPCTRFTGITVRRPRVQRRRRRTGLVVWRWPVDAPWVRDVTFGHWVSYQSQGLCEGATDCEQPATFWVSYHRGLPDATDAPSCERCLARRRQWRAEESALDAPARMPTPVAYWNPALDAWDVRPHDGSPTELA